MGRDESIVPVDLLEVRLEKNSTDRSRNWILMDSSGQRTVLDIDKYAIMQRFQIPSRDLRILDPRLSCPSIILGREKAILLNLEHIKAIITADEVLLRDPLDDNVIPVVEELRRRLGGQNDVEAGEEFESPFEFRALEVALEAICSFLAACTTELENDAHHALDELTSKISSITLDGVRKLKNAMTRLTARVQKVRDELEKLLGDDDDMADLYLSRKLGGTFSPVSGLDAPICYPPSPNVGSKISRASRASVVTVGEDKNDVGELEMLLEAYFIQIDGTLNKLTQLREYIDDTEDLIKIQLDSGRNKLIQLEFFHNAGMVSLSICSLVAGIFGMNIPFAWNDNPYMFKWVVIVTGVVGAIVFILIVSFARCKGLVGN